MQKALFYYYFSFKNFINDQIFYLKFREINLQIFCAYSIQKTAAIEQIWWKTILCLIYKRIILLIFTLTPYLNYPKFLPYDPRKLHLKCFLPSSIFFKTVSTSVYFFTSHQQKLSIFFIFHSFYCKRKILVIHHISMTSVFFLKFLILTVRPLNFLKHVI